MNKPTLEIFYFMLELRYLENGEEKIITFENWFKFDRWLVKQKRKTKNKKNYLSVRSI